VRDPSAPGLHAGSNDALVYGEVDVASFAEIFAAYLPDLPRSGGLFVDLGSGTGRAVFAAWLLHDFEKCVGVELLKSLNDIADSTLDKYRAGRQNKKPKLAAPRKGQDKDRSKSGKQAFHHEQEELDARPAVAFEPFGLDPSRVEFTLGDLRRFEWSRADCVFCAATCFDGPLLQHIADTAAKLRSGAYLISLSEALKGEHLRLVNSIVFRMSWGRATVHIHQRI
jgi:SAM-dependent methyltransferase